MAAKPLVETFRFDEGRETYESFTVITYFFDEATLHGLDRPISLSQARQLIGHLRKHDIKILRYVRRGRLKVQEIKEKRKA